MNLDPQPLHMEDGTITVTAGAAAEQTTLVSGQPCSLIGLYISMDSGGAGFDPAAMPLTITVYDEAAPADIDANSKVLQRIFINDPSADGQSSRNLAIKAGKGLCLKISACLTNDLLVGLTWR